MRRVDGCLLGIAGPDALWLATPVTLTGRAMAHDATFTVMAGERVPFVLSWVPSHEDGPERLRPAPGRQAETQKFWDEWVSRCTYQGTYREAVVRSLITLKALTYLPTGGIVAAPPPRFPRTWRGAGTGTTATAGCGTPPSPSWPSSKVVPQRGPAWRAWLSARWPETRPICRSCTAWPGSGVWTNGPGLAGRLRELGAGADRQRRRRPTPARRLRRGHGRPLARPPRAIPVDRHAGPCNGICCPSWRRSGGSPMRESGRSAARGGTSFTPR